MAERQFEISKRVLITKCSVATLLGSLISVWLFILWNYFSTVKDLGYYSAPFSILEMHLICIPILGYQLPAYLVSSLIGMNLVKRGWIKSAMAAYLGAGVAGWLISTLLMFVSGTDYTLDAVVGALGIELPSLLLYLVFLFPKYVE
jgi:hypothetical protein